MKRNRHGPPYLPWGKRVRVDPASPEEPPREFFQRAVVLIAERKTAKLAQAKSAEMRVHASFDELIELMDAGRDAVLLAVEQLKSRVSERSQTD